MAIIVSRNQKNAKRLEPVDFALESEIQSYIYDNPNVIPLYEIDDDIRLFVACREFQTKSGRIDGLGFDRRGNIYIIETKLYRNPDKRTVVAQALDYGASLWKYATNFDEFLSQLSKHTQKQFGVDFKTKYSEFFGLEDATDNLSAICDNLNTGDIKFVVLMDKLYPALKDLIIYINQNSQFDIYASTLEYYRHNDIEIVIPKLFGSEVKKDVVSRKSTGSDYQDITIAEFDNLILESESLSNDSKQIMLKLRSLYRTLSDRYDGSTFCYSSKSGNSGFGVNDNDHKQATLLSLTQGIRFYQKDKSGRIASFNKRVLNRLIDEGLLEKTKQSLSTSQWVIKPSMLISDDEKIKSELWRFLEISEEEAAPTTSETSVSMDDDIARSLIADLRWTFAKTYADKSPHEYAVVKVNNPRRDEVVAFMQYIVDHGYVELYYGKPFTVYKLDGRKYWTMASDKKHITDEEYILNRSMEYNVDTTYGNSSPNP